jgi:hypothetical protein
MICDYYKTVWSTTYNVYYCTFAASIFEYYFTFTLLCITFPPLLFLISPASPSYLQALSLVHNPWKGQDRKGREWDCTMLFICNHSQPCHSWGFRELCIVVFVYITQSPFLPFPSVGCAPGFTDSYIAKSSLIVKRLPTLNRLFLYMRVFILLQTTNN